MIKIFRNIRQSSLMESKTYKYLLYALGEIILVIIGILLALQINSWNEERVENKQELYLLKQIKYDIIRDSLALSSFIKLTHGKTVQGNNLKKAIISKNYNYAIDSLVVNAFLVGRTLSFEAYTPTFDELISSGGLRILKSDALKESIKRYINFNETNRSFMYQESQKRKEAYNSHIYKYLEPQIMTFLWETFPTESINMDSLKNYSINRKGFLEDPQSLYHLNVVIGVDRELSWFYSQRLMVRIQDIINKVNLEIDKHNDKTLSAN